MLLLYRLLGKPVHLAPARPTTREAETETGDVEEVHAIDRLSRFGFRFIRGAKDKGVKDCFVAFLEHTCASAHTIVCTRFI